MRTSMALALSLVLVITVTSPAHADPTLTINTTASVGNTAYTVKFSLKNLGTLGLKSVQSL